MEGDGLLYESLFLLFAGFLIVTGTVLNKDFMILSVVDTYFVLFLFLGIVLSSIGSGIMMVWKFRSRPLFAEGPQQNRFVPYLAFGIFAIMTSVVFIHYIGLTSAMTIVAVAFMVLGIYLLVRGLKYFIEEAFNQKTPGHS